MTASQRPGIVRPPPGSVRMAWRVTAARTSASRLGGFEPTGVDGLDQFAIFVMALMPFWGSVGWAVGPTAVTFHVEMPG